MRCVVVNYVDVIEKNYAGACVEVASVNTRLERAIQSKPKVNVYLSHVGI